MGRPTSSTLHHRLIELNGKEHVWLALHLLAKSGFYLMLDPLASHRVGRQDKQELVVEANRLIDAVPCQSVGISPYVSVYVLVTIGAFTCSSAQASLLPLISVNHLSSKTRRFLLSILTPFTSSVVRLIVIS